MGSAVSIQKPHRGDRPVDAGLTVGYQVARLAPLRWRAPGELDPYASAARQVDCAVRNSRVLARYWVSPAALLWPVWTEVVVSSGIVRR